MRTAISGQAIEYKFRPNFAEHLDISVLLSEVEEPIAKLINSHLTNRQHGIKFQVLFHFLLEKFSFEFVTLIQTEAYFNSRTQQVLSRNQTASRVKHAVHSAIARFDTFVQRGSGWILKDVLSVTLRLAKFKVFRGGCLRESLPSQLKTKRGIICWKSTKRESASNSNKCFLYSLALLLTSTMKTKNVTRIGALERQLIKSWPTHCLEFPVTLKHIIKFENATDLSINVYGYEDSKLFPYYVSELIDKKQHHVNLLLHEGHYYGIKDMSAVVKNVNRVKTDKWWICNFCLASFAQQRVWEIHQHQFFCSKEGIKRYQLPDGRERVPQKFFKAKSNIVPIPFVIYADLESMMGPKCEDLKGKQISSISHSCVSWAAYTVCRDRPDWNVGPVLYSGAESGENCINSLILHLSKELVRAQTLLQTTNIPLVMSIEEEVRFQGQDECEMCGALFDTDPGSLFTARKKVRDHNHLTGAYRWALCNGCNLGRAKPKSQVMVFFHGLTNYDSHFIIQQLNNFVSDDNQLSVIPRSSEKYLSFSLDDLVFKDSYSFLAGSLESLVSHLKTKGECYFQHLKAIVPNQELRQLLYEKGVFPYSYLTSLDVLKERKLPPASAFFNDLTQRHISADSYKFARKVWDSFECKTFEDYLKVYLLTDVLLLADVFENFRSNSMMDYGLDPAHYFSSAHFTFDAFLSFTGMRLDLICDINQYLMFDKMIRGGLSMVCKRFSAANHPALESYDETKPEKHIIYLDANNLYGWAMMQPLPYRDFVWVDSQLLNQVLQDILQDKVPAEIGYVLSVDLEYPEELHDYHNDLPLAPEKRIIRERDLSPFAEAIRVKHNIKLGHSAKKLVTTFFPKEAYVCYHKNLALYCSLGMKVKRVNYALSFKQSPFMRPYIEFNSDKRAQANNEFDVGFYKFLTNSLFGKTMERPDNKSQLKLITKLETFEKFASKLTFKQLKIINPNLVAMEMNPVVFKIDKPFYLGAIILDLAKYHMYDFHYRVMKPHFGKNLQLLYTDTDSFIYEIQLEKGQTLEKELLQIPGDVFDFSNHPVQSPLHSDRQKRVPGKFKDESAGKPIYQFVGLRSKMYAIKTQDEETKHAKGVKKSVLNNDLSFKDFYECLFKGLQLENDFRNITSKCHQVVTKHQSKISLSSFDDKRWLRDDGVLSYSYGHKNTI